MRAPQRVITASDAGAPTPARRVHRAWRRDVVEFCGWLSIALAVGIYLAGRSSADWSSASAALTTLGMVSGLVATDLFVLQLLLAARIPFVDHAMGHDRALAHHRRLTVWSMSLVGVHVVALTASWSLDANGLFRGVADLWSTADIPLSVLGLGLLCAVGVSSFEAARRRLPHEVWYVIHLLTYAGIGASVPHMFSDSRLLVGGAKVYWAALLLVTGFCLLTFRWVLPLAQSLEHRLVVDQVRWVTPDSVEISMTGRDLSGLGGEAGQFLTWRFLDPRLVWHAHPLSLSAAPDGRRLRVTMRILGRGTDQIAHRLRPGTKVLAAGPYGIMTASSGTSDAVVLAGSGVGLAPIRALLETVDVAPGRALLIARASRHEDLVHYDEIVDLCRERGIRLVTLVGHRFHPGPGRPAARSWTPDNSPVQLSQLAPWVRQADLYVCGPQAWTDELVAEARAIGVPDRQIHEERFSW